MANHSRFVLTRITVLVFVALVILLSGCSGRRGTNLRRYDLFTVPLGTLPGELDWFYREGFRMAGTAEIQTRDGLVYLSGGEAGKVMVFNSYGDLITFVYDPTRNPAPAKVDDDEERRSVSSWSLRNPRAIAAFDGGFLVEDGVENERRVEDAETGVFHDRVILRFDKDGDYIGHLGREGLGGSPFPYVVGLDVREDGGVVVTSRIPGAWMSYWFDKAGHPVATVRIREDQLPGLNEGGEVAVYSVRPDPVSWTLHIRLDVYPDERRGDRPEPRLYSLDLTTLIYNDPIVLGYVEGDEESGRPAIPPDYIGTTRTGVHVMLSPQGPEQYRLVLVDPEGRVVQNRRLTVESSANIYRRFRLQNDGMLTGIFFDNQKASVAWWRVDKLLDDES